MDRMEEGDQTHGEEDGYVSQRTLRPGVRMSAHSWGLHNVRFNNKKLEKYFPPQMETPRDFSTYNVCEKTASRGGDGTEWGSIPA